MTNAPRHARWRGGGGPVVRLAAINAVGFSGSMAIWIALFGERFGLPPWSGPLVATMQLAVTALCNIATPGLVRGRAKPTIGWIGAAMIVAGNLVSLAMTPATFAGGCALSGAGYGILLNATNAMAVDTPSPSRAYATIPVINVLFSMAFFLTMPEILAHAGLRAVFVALALLGGGAIVALTGYAQATPAGETVASASARLPGLSLVSLVSLGAVALLFIGESTISSYLVPLG